MPSKIVGTYAFFIMIMFWWGVPDASVLPRWSLVALSPALILWMPPSHITLQHLLGLCAIGWAALSLHWSANAYDGVAFVLHMAFLCAVFGLGMRVDNMRPVYIGAGLGLWLSSVSIGFEWFGYHPIQPFVMQNAGLFLNPNLLAEVTALVVVGVVIHKIWWLLPGLIPSLIMPGARGALVAVGLTGSIWLWRKSPKLTMAFAVAGLIVLVLWSIDGGKAMSTNQRLLLTMDNLRCLTFWGFGAGSYDTIFPYCAQSLDIMKYRPISAHNDYLQFLIELGIGAVLFFALPISCIWGAFKAERYVVIAFMVEALFGFPSYMPATAFMAALAMGHLCRDRVAVFSIFRGGRELFREGLRRAGFRHEPSLRARGSDVLPI